MKTKSILRALAPVVSIAALLTGLAASASALAAPFTWNGTNNTWTSLN